MIADAVRDLLHRRGVDVDQVVWAEVADRPPAADSHRWVAWPTDGDEIVLGGLDHGRFSAYARFGDPGLAADVLARWLDPRLPPAPRDEEALLAASAAVADQLLRTDAAGSGPLDGAGVPAGVLPVGAPLDHVGTASGHVLHLYGTAFSARSLPPSDLDEDRIGFVLNEPLPATCRVERVPAWFGQPGGGLMVTLDRVIAYYADTGTLGPFAVG